MQSVLGCSNSHGFHKLISPAYSPKNRLIYACLIHCLQEQATETYPVMVRRKPVWQRLSRSNRKWRWSASAERCMPRRRRDNCASAAPLLRSRSARRLWSVGSSSFLSCRSTVSSQHRLLTTWSCREAHKRSFYSSLYANCPKISSVFRILVITCRRQRHFRVTNVMATTSDWSHLRN